MASGNNKVLFSHLNDPRREQSFFLDPIQSFSKQADKWKISSLLSLLMLSCTEQQIWQEKPHHCQLLYWAGSLPNELRTSVLLPSDASDESPRLTTKWKQSFLLESAGRYNNIDVMQSVCRRSHISKAW